MELLFRQNSIFVFDTRLALFYSTLHNATSNRVHFVVKRCHCTCQAIEKRLVLRDCSLFMPKGGSVVFKQFRHMKNLPLPGSGFLKKLPPVYVTGPNCNPPYPHSSPLRTQRASDCKIAYNTCSDRLPINQYPLQGHL